MSDHAACFALIQEAATTCPRLGAVLTEFIHLRILLGSTRDRVMRLVNNVAKHKRNRTLSAESEARLARTRAGIATLAETAAMLCELGEGTRKRKRGDQDSQTTATAPAPSASQMASRWLVSTKAPNEIIKMVLGTQENGREEEEEEADNGEPPVKRRTLSEASPCVPRTRRFKGGRVPVACPTHRFLHKKCPQKKDQCERDLQALQSRGFNITRLLTMVPHESANTATAQQQ